MVLKTKGNTMNATKIYAIGFVLFVSFLIVTGTMLGNAMQTMAN